MTYSNLNGDINSPCSYPRLIVDPLPTTNLESKHNYLWSRQIDYMLLLKS